jgi:hypothetical protein
MGPDSICEPTKGLLTLAQEVKALIALGVSADKAATIAATVE